jgi:hypothetical protein
MGFNSAFKGLRWNFRKWVGGDMDWIELAQDRDR